VQRHHVLLQRDIARDFAREQLGASSLSSTLFGRAQHMSYTSARITPDGQDKDQFQEDMIGPELAELVSSLTTGAQVRAKALGDSSKIREQLYQSSGLGGSVAVPRRTVLGTCGQSPEHATALIHLHGLSRIAKQAKPDQAFSGRDNGFFPRTRCPIEQAYRLFAGCVHI
jgi:hypothetical protein